MSRIIQEGEISPDNKIKRFVRRGCLAAYDTDDYQRVYTTYSNNYNSKYYTYISECPFRHRYAGWCCWPPYEDWRKL